MVLLIGLTLSFIFLSGLVAMIDAAVLSVSRAETEEAIAHELWAAPCRSSESPRALRNPWLLSSS